MNEEIDRHIDKSEERPEAGISHTLACENTARLATKLYAGAVAIEKYRDLNLGTTGSQHFTTRNRFRLLSLVAFPSGAVRK